MPKLFIVISWNFWHAFAEPQGSDESALKDTGLSRQCLVIGWEL